MTVHFTRDAAGSGVPVLRRLFFMSAFASIQELDADLKF